MHREAPCTFLQGKCQKNPAISEFLKEYGFSSVFMLSFTELGILTQSISFHRFGGFFVFKKRKITKKQGTFSNQLFQLYYPVVTDKQSQKSQEKMLKKLSI